MEPPPTQATTRCALVTSRFRGTAPSAAARVHVVEFRLLVTLHDRRDQVQSRDTLLSDVWGISPDITTRTVDTHVKRLRSKLGEAADYVRTVRGVGYLFSASPDERP
jgi:two-component system phosphate regulon response regulator PhoB